MSVKTRFGTKFHVNFSGFIDIKFLFFPAAQAIPFLRSLPDPTPSSAMTVKVPANPTSSTVTETNATANKDQTKNAIMFLNEIGMTHGLPIEWTVLGDQGPPHQRTFSWKVTMSAYEATGSALNKKAAKTIAAQNLIELLPAELKDVSKAKVEKRKAKKRKVFGKGNGGPGLEAKRPNTALLIDGKLISQEVPSSAPIVSAPATETTQTMSINSKPIGPQLPPGGVPKSAKGQQSLSGQAVHTVIQNPNAISAIYEYCKKGKINFNWGKVF